MSTAICITATLLALLTVPVLVLLWLTESPLQRQTRRARRLRSQGWTQSAIAAELGISRSTVRMRLAAA